MCELAHNITVVTQVCSVRQIYDINKKNIRTLRNFVNKYK